MDLRAKQEEEGDLLSIVDKGGVPFCETSKVCVFFFVLLAYKIRILHKVSDGWLILIAKCRSSSILFYVSVQLSYTISAQSKCGRTNDLYKVSKAFLLMLYL